MTIDHTYLSLKAAINTISLHGPNSLRHTSLTHQLTWLVVSSNCFDSLKATLKFQAEHLFSKLNSLEFNNNSLDWIKTNHVSTSVRKKSWQMTQDIPMWSQGKLYVFYVVANLYEFLRCESYKNVRLSNTEGPPLTPPLNLTSLLRKQRSLAPHTKANHTKTYD